VGSNIDTKQKLVKLTITEYSAKHNISSATCRNWIKSGKVEFEMVKGKYFILTMKLLPILQNLIQTLLAMICY